MRGLPLHVARWQRQGRTGESHAFGWIERGSEHSKTDQQIISLKILPPTRTASTGGRPGVPAWSVKRCCSRRTRLYALRVLKPSSHLPHRLVFPRTALDNRSVPDARWGRSKKRGHCANIGRVEQQLGGGTCRIPDLGSLNWFVWMRNRVFSDLRGGASKPRRPENVSAERWQPLRRLKYRTGWRSIGPRGERRKADEPCQWSKSHLSS